MKNLQLDIQALNDLYDIYADSRKFGYQGPTRNVRLYRATPSGGGAISKSEDGVRCAVAGKESLRIVRLSDGTGSHNPGHKSSVGPGGHRLDASRNFWDGSGLKIDSASTDVAWGHGVFNNKILTSARNGELIMWDLIKSGASKYERRSKDHLRSVHAMSVSHIVHHYCITGSADGDVRVWDLRDLSRSLMRVHHPTSVRSVVFSPSTWQPFHAVIGLDNGSIYRWDLKMGQRGLLDRLPVAHTASVTSLDWCNLSVSGQNHSANAMTGGPAEGPGNGLGWLVSGGLDRCVKVWDLTTPGLSTRIPNKPTYTLHPSLPVRHVAWRPGYECELAVVLNAEFSTGSNSDMGQGMITGAGSEGDEHAVDAKASLAVGGDAVEIWDVRRGWIPKWSVTGSAIEGGVTDLAFGDSDAVWAHHSSGTFSQIDLRNCTKPLDAITRTAATWEASGSLAFIAEKRSKWQIPYDDIHPDRRLAAEKQEIKFKSIGDRHFAPDSQDMGTLISDQTVDEVEVFKQLAEGYIIEGEDRLNICSTNARIAFEAGKDQAAQTWLLLGACLAECVARSPATVPLLQGKRDSPISHSVSAPAAISSNSYTPTPSGPSQLRKASPGQGSIHSPDSRIPQRSGSTSASRKMTPASSTSSSPRQMPGPLPPITPRRPSVFGGREAMSAELIRRSSMSLYRRPSVSTHSMHSTSPGEKSVGGSLRHVGEGALDDSDSSSDSESGGDDNNGEGSTDEEVSLRPLISPGLPPTRTIPTPSPLSRVAGQQQWTEDESEGKDNDDDDEASSPSPRSTDTDSSEAGSPRRRPKSNSKSSSRRHSIRIKPRSRSSTVASLAAPPMRTLTHQDSYSSIRTVTAGDVSFRENDVESPGLRAEETLRDIRVTHARQKSLAVSDFALDTHAVDEGAKEEFIDAERLSDRRIEMVRSDEKRFRDLTWDALREALESFADSGDIQTCAMLAIVAPGELQIPQRRINRFLDAYLDLLTRRRLHACAAYLRKYCQVEEANTVTLLETTIYTACGKCRKPLMVPAGTQIPGQAVKGGYSYCKACKSPCAVCSICRLPVRALLLQCSICSHGGHQTCYRKYYMQRPMVELPGSSTAENRDQSSRRSSPSDSIDEDASFTTSILSSAFDAPLSKTPARVGFQRRLAGHPCAAGCGHFCWATNNNPDEI